MSFRASGAEAYQSSGFLAIIRWTRAHTGLGRSGRFCWIGGGSLLRCWTATATGAFAAERRLPRQHVVARDAEGVDVAPLVERVAVDLGARLM